MYKLLTLIGMLLSLDSCSDPEWAWTGNPDLSVIPPVDANRTFKAYPIQVAEDMLCFPSYDAFSNVLNSLIKLKEGQDKALIQHAKQRRLNLAAPMECSPSLNDDSQQMSTASFREDAILHAFESYYEFNSLRMKIGREMVTFLSYPNPDWNRCPEYHYILGDVERTLFNERGEIRIGSSIFKITSDGGVFEVPTDNTDLLKELNEPPYNSTDLPDGIVQHQAASVTFLANGVSPGICESTKSATFLPISYNNGINQYIGILGIRNYGFMGAVYSAVFHFEWNGNLWEKANAFLQTQNWGQISNTLFNGLCVVPQSYQSNHRIRFGNRIYSRKITHSGSSVPKMIRSGWLHSSHTANTSGHFFQLIW